jgi:tRNA-(ms[2]io[6]A)-hydroxylase
MLCLQTDTNPEWIDIAAQHPIEILIDHAHCEKKAASNAISMITRYPEKDTLVQEMITIIQEETEHFERVVKLLREKGYSLTKDKGSMYAQKLSKHIRKEEPCKLLDFLLVDALIEARSCERFSVLYNSDKIPEELRTLYRELFESEAGHYRTFTDIAREYFPKEEVRERLHELAKAEAEIVKSLPNNPTMHG